MQSILEDACRRAVRFLRGLDHRSVQADPAAVAALTRLEHDLPFESSDPATVLALLDGEAVEGVGRPLVQGRQKIPVFLPERPGGE